MNVTKQPATFEFATIRWAYIGLVIGMFSASISQTIVGPAIPRIVADLGGLAWYSWLSTIVMLVSAVVTPVSGKLSDIFGRRRFYVIGLLLFMLGSVLSGMATSFSWLIAARTIQGMGMGILMPLSQTILGVLIPPRQRGKYQGYMGAVMGASQVAGPLIGGWITDVSSWRWLFYISMPVGLVAMVIILKHLHIPEESVRGKIDHAGISTMTIGVSAALLGISLGGQNGWGEPQVLVLLLVGFVFSVAFVWVERRAEEPIVPMHLFRNSIFTFATVGAFFMNMAMMAVLIYVPVYAQGVLGVSATESGLILIPMNVVLFSVGIVIGQLTSRTGRYKEFAVAGTVVQVIGALVMLRLDGDSSRLELVAATSILGLGYGMAFQIYVLAVQNAVQRRDLGVATSALQFFRNIGNTLGTAIAGTIMTTQLMSGIERGMTEEMSERIPTGGLNPNAVLHPAELLYLPEPLAQLLRSSLDGAMQSVFLILPVLTLLSLAGTLFIKAIPLRDTFAQPEERGRELLDATAMSAPDQERVRLSPEDSKARSKERIMGAHLILLAEQVRDDNPILRDVVAEFGGGDLGRGMQVLRSTGMMLLTEDPEVVDEHEAFAVEMSKRGKQEQMLSADITARLDAVSDLVANRRERVTRPRIDTAEGIDGAGLRRAIMMLDSALVADIATRRWEPEP